MTKIVFPSSSVLENAVIDALKSMGGSGTSKEIDELVLNNLQLEETVLQVMRSGGRSEIRYRLAWVRTKAKKKGLISKTSTHDWSLGKE